MRRKQIFLVLFLTLASMAIVSFYEENLLLLKAEAAERIAVIEARKNVIKGQAILVCSYDSDEKFNTMRLQGAIPLSTFKDKLKSIGKE
ncbi:MAG: hypothetical protein AMK69_03085, partial [Nitrospira bacterium SG8_3]